MAPDGIFVHSEFKNNIPSDTAEIRVEAVVLNTLTDTATAVVECAVVAPDGRPLTRFKESEKVGGGAQETVKLESKVSSPVL